jgi:hypothetical protein
VRSRIISTSAPSPRLAQALAVPHDGEDLRGRRELAVADELDGGQLGAEALIDAFASAPSVRPKLAPARARSRCAFHRSLGRRTCLLRHAEAGVREDLLGQIHGEAVGVVEREQEPTSTVRVVARASAPLAHVLLDLPHAGVERLGEALLLVAHGVLHACALGHELGVRVAHQRHHPVHRAPEEGLGEPELATVTHGPPHDPPQDVTTPLVRRGDAVRDEERRGARVVGDDPHGDVTLLVRPVRQADEGGHLVDEGRNRSVS